MCLFIPKTEQKHAKCIRNFQLFRKTVPTVWLLPSPHSLLPLLLPDQCGELVQARTQLLNLIHNRCFCALKTTSKRLFSKWKV
jgi:hypothetical protein